MTSIDYTLKRVVRARYVRVVVGPDARVRVTAPYGVSKRAVERLLRERETHIREQQQHMERRAKDPLLRHSREDYQKYKEQARALVHKRLEHFSGVYGFTYNAVRIKQHVSRWGSCSKKGNLNFNYKIVLLPPHLADYIIVHELCHLGELNHSPKFWALVAKTVPEYDAARRELRMLARAGSST